MSKLNTFLKMPVIVHHQAIEQEWLTPNQIISPKTLVLGSFNPFNGNQNLVDYYYGRTSNHFWKSIAVIVGEQENYFFHQDEGLDRKIRVMQNKFCCLDVINSIEFNGNEQNVVTNYLNHKIFTNFSDQNIWCTNTKFGGTGHINLQRTYNQLVIQTLEDNDSIKKVIHTMGSNRININATKPVEAGLGEFGFSGFVSKIISICDLKGKEFVYTTFSPSDYAVRNGQTNREHLQQWLRQNLWL